MVAIAGDRWCCNDNSVTKVQDFPQDIASNGCLFMYEMRGVALINLGRLPYYLALKPPKRMHQDG